MIFRKIYRFLSSSKLAMALLVVIFACCIIGVTIIRGERAWSLIFRTAWFNGLLVLLVANVAFCFFGRIWGRRLTLVSFGMILFHLSFVAVFAGIVYNSLFYFRGEIRLTEEETLPSGDPQSYDSMDHGPFFHISSLKGETRLIKMHTDYTVNGKNKRWAYEVEVGEKGMKKKGMVYMTNHLGHNGFRYFRNKEGYSLLLILHDGRGEPLAQQFIPLQSLKQKSGNYLYASGSPKGPGSFPFPFPDGLSTPAMRLQVAFYPDITKPRTGEVGYQLWPLDSQDGVKPAKNGKNSIGEKIYFAGYDVSVKEVRYWSSMSVRYEPGQPIILTSLWTGLTGLVLATLGRLRRKKRGRTEQSAGQPVLGAEN